MGYEPGLQPEAKHIAIKMPVFSFEKIRGADISLGPEMKSTGECLGIAETFNAVSYTHLDVYKRQQKYRKSRQPGMHRKHMHQRAKLRKQKTKEAVKCFHLQSPVESICWIIK